MVCGTIGVLERNAVKCDGVLTIREAAEIRLALTEADSVGLRLNVPGAMFTTSAKSETGEVKFLMNGPLISVFAEVASSVFPEGTICAASETVSSTVTAWDKDATFNEIEISSRPPAESWIPARLFLAKPVAAASIE